MSHSSPDMNYKNKPVSDLPITERLTKHLNDQGVFTIEEFLSCELPKRGTRLGNESHRIRQLLVDLGEDIFDDHRIDEWREKEPFADDGGKSPDSRTMKRLCKEYDVTRAQIAEWLDITPQRVQQYVTKKGDSSWNWLNYPLTEQDRNLIEEMLEAGMDYLEANGAKGYLFQRDSGETAAIIVTERAIKCYYL